MMWKMNQYEIDREWERLKKNDEWERMLDEW
jgi:hypothetical protein